MANWDITTNAELKDAVRAATSYEDTSDELPSSQLDAIIERAKHRVSLETGSDQWYSDSGLGLVLFAYTCLRAKSAVENIPLDSYSLGDEDVSFQTDDPEDSIQLQQWAEDVRVGLNASSVDSGPSRTPTNTAGYIGESYVPE